MWSHKAPLFIFVFLLFGCSAGVDFQDVDIKNNHTETIMVDIWDLESSNMVDPNPAVSVDEVSFLQINSMNSLTVSKSDIKGDSGSDQFRLFLYEVREDSAFYKKSFSVSSSQEINIHHGADGYFID